MSTNLHPLFRAILKPIAPPLPTRTEWEEYGFTVPDELCSPERPSDAEAHFARTDPGQSLPGECRHDFFAIGRGKYRCCHCGMKIEEEP